jgi:hypothetical protein
MDAENPAPAASETHTDRPIPAHVKQSPTGKTPYPVLEAKRNPGDVGSPEGDGQALLAAPKPMLSGEDAAKGERLVRQLHFRVSSWRPRLVRDVILPTLPVREGEDDAMESLRERCLLESKNQVPESFKSPVLWSGCIFEMFTADAGAGQSLCWRDATVSQAGGTTANGQRAEISWPGGIPPANADYVLRGARDRVIASVTVRQGDVMIKAAGGVRCWYWVAAEPAAADCARQPPGGVVPRFAWEIRDGPVMSPDLIRRDERWLNGRAQRLELPLDLGEGEGTISNVLAFVDRATGWAIGGGIEQTR